MNFKVGFSACLSNSGHFRDVSILFTRGRCTSKSAVSAAPPCEPKIKSLTRHLSHLWPLFPYLSKEFQSKNSSKALNNLWIELPIGVFVDFCCLFAWTLDPGTSCLRLKYWLLILSGRGMFMVMALWNFRLRGSIVTIGLTDPPWTIISSTISSSTGRAHKPTSTRLTSVLQKDVCQKKSPKTVQKSYFGLW